MYCMEQTAKKFKTEKLIRSKVTVNSLGNPEEEKKKLQWERIKNSTQNAIKYSHVETHTHTRLTALCPGLPG